MITRKNYEEQLLKVNVSQLPKDVLEAKEFFDEITKSGSNWDMVYADDAIQDMVDVYFKSLQHYVIDEVSKSSGKSKESKPKVKVVTLKKELKPKRTNAPRLKSKPKRLEKRPAPIIRETGVNAQKVELVDLELKFIRRYINMHEKVKSHNQIRLFLNGLQRAIIEKRILKTSQFAKEIEEIQSDLIMLFDTLKSSKNKPIIIGEKRLKQYSKLIGKQVEMESSKLIKSYVGLQGKFIENKRVENLQSRINRAIKKGKISKRDRYWDEIDRIQSNLKSFIQKNKKGGTLSIGSKELNGLNGIMKECGLCELSGLPNGNLKNTVMRSTDFVKVKFDKLDFRGKWLDFIGNPSRGFKTMIFGLPKTGKSYLMVEFAGYLVRNHGTVLYVAKEEELDDTLQAKLKDKNVEHPDLYVSDYIPDDLSPYDFVFLDSVTKLRLTPEQLEQLGRKYPDTSFIYIFQTTKHGAFRGSNEFQHDVDVVIEVPEKGKAIQFGRFNQGGEIDIFNNSHKRSA